MSAARRAHAFERGVPVVEAGQVHDRRQPARFVENETFDARDAKIVADVDQDGALGAGFADIAALQIAGKHDPGVARDLLVGVDVSERPVVVATGGELGDAGRCVGVVPLAPVEAGVEDADVEEAGPRRRIAAHQRVRFRGGTEAAAMQDDADVGNLETLRLAGVEDVQSLWPVAACG